MNKPKIVETRTMSVLSPELADAVRSMRMRHAMFENDCFRTVGDQGPRSVPTEIPRVKVQRNRVYTGEGEAGTYNHHSQIAKFKGRYYFAWSNSEVYEDYPGQSTMLAVSDTGEEWSQARCVVPGDFDSGFLRWTSGLYSDDKKLYLFGVAHYATLDATVPGMRRFEWGRSRLDMHVSSDGENWEAYEGIAGDKTFIFEEPRFTEAGRLMCGGTQDGRPVALFFDPDDMTASTSSGQAAPLEVVRMPKPEGIADFPYGETSWYQTREGLIVMWFRDEAQSLRLFAATSEDEGRSWSQPMLTDFPDSMSRVRAGNLPDGRCYLIGNAYPKLLDRSKLMCAFSDDGIVFDRMYILLDDPTAQRAFGLLKVHGYQYPVTLAEPGRLLIGYSVNKEDIEFGTLNTDAL